MANIRRISFRSLKIKPLVNHTSRRDEQGVQCWDTDEPLRSGGMAQHDDEYQGIVCGGVVFVVVQGNTCVLQCLGQECGGIHVRLEEIPSTYGRLRELARLMRRRSRLRQTV